MAERSGSALETWTVMWWRVWAGGGGVVGGRRAASAVVKMVEYLAMEEERMVERRVGTKVVVGAMYKVGWS